MTDHDEAPAAPIVEQIEPETASDDTPAATGDEHTESKVTSDETPTANTDEPGEHETTTDEPDAVATETEPTTRETELAAIRDLVLRAHPDVVPELIAGDSIEALLASIPPAEAAFQRIAERFPQPAPPPPPPSVPAGGGQPALIDAERLPADEKIRRGLTTRRP